jgi:uncharacterized protein
MDAHQTREVAERWFAALRDGNVSAIEQLLAPNIEWINYTVVPGYNDIMPWIGTYHSLPEVLRTFEVFVDLVDVQREEVISMIVEGDQAAGVIHEHSIIKATGAAFDIEFVQWLTVKHRQIVRWKSYTDPSPIIRAMRSGL